MWHAVRDVYRGLLLWQRWVIAFWLGLHDLQGHTGDDFVVHLDIKGVLAGFGEGDALEINHDVVAEEEGVFRDGRDVYIEGGAALREDAAAIGIDHGELHTVLADIAFAEEKTEGYGAVLVDAGKTGCPDRIEGSHDAEFAIVVGCKVTN